jgi:hypothetical protein
LLWRKLNFFLVFFIIVLVLRLSILLLGWRGILKSCTVRISSELSIVDIGVGNISSKSVSLEVHLNIGHHPRNLVQSRGNVAEYSTQIRHRLPLGTTSHKRVPLAKVKMKVRVSLGVWLLPWNIISGARSECMLIYMILN